MSQWILLTVTAQDPGDLIGSLAEAYVNSRCLHVAANLGVADILTDEPRTLAAVARELDVEPTALGRLLRHLASLGVFAMHADNVWNNEASTFLRAGHPDGLLPLTRMLALPIMWDSFGALDQAVRTGRPGARFHDPEGFFAYLDAHPAESDVYDEGMAAMTTRRIARTIPHYDFSGFRVVADIGGGGGHLLRAVLDSAPQARGVLFDREQVLNGVAPSDRVSLHPGSFLADPLPAADCYLLSNIIHDWSDDDAVTILRAVRQAAPEDSTLLLFEFVIPEDPGEFEASDIDVYMLALVGGRERSLPEYDELLTKAGWRLQRSVPTPVQSILEAVPRD
jgi:hypothetical protein